ncbi:carbohydrate ABC transporter permease [Tropicimonas sp. IMCC34043]|uniref:carbohydrate ABC transporter permease n=1 Tax=Tropicimonas sp. IMCC34043 TaxID=2248760 RepID=UPI000E22CE99|nr:carbohydrate ABC transporter permease [Tropicimonas sp. IMCC34043]
MSRLRIAMIWAVTVILFWPILWMVMTSFKPPGEYVSTSISILPHAPSLEHFRQIAADGILGKVMNSLIVTAGAAILSLLAGFPAAYALVRMRLPARLDKAFLVFVLLVKLAPPLVLAIPLYQVLRGVHLLDTLGGLILVYQVYTLPFAIWMLLGFVRDVAPSYEEAAVMDGAGLGYRLVTIVLPIMAPGIAATFILLTILAWNEFAYALLFIQTPSHFTLPTYIATLITEDETFWGRLMAIGLVASLPILTILAFFQRHLVTGLAGGLK